jgi:cytochrome c oxidase subunit IV
LLYAILFPCSAILLFLFIMWHESYWTLLIRKIYFMIAGS